MSALEWAGFAAGITTTFIGVLAGLRYLVRGWLNELRPNGGSSMKDSVARLERQVEEIYRILLARNNS
jgi:hypothetical protein